METVQDLTDRQNYNTEFKVLVNTIAWDNSDSAYKIFDGINWNRLVEETEPVFKDQSVVSAVEQLSTEAEAEEKFNVFEKTVQLPDPGCFPSNPNSIENLIEQQSLINLLNYRMQTKLAQMKRRFEREYPQTAVEINQSRTVGDRYKGTIDWDKLED